jgi:uncharacterized membrane protein YGL010W
MKPGLNITRHSGNRKPVLPDSIRIQLAVRLAMNAEMISMTETFKSNKVISVKIQMKKHAMYEKTRPIIIDNCGNVSICRLHVQVSTTDSGVQTHC